MGSAYSDREEWRWWLGLLRVPGVGPVTYRALLEACHSPREVFAASHAALTRVPGCSPRVAAAIRRFSGWPDVDAELARLGGVGASLVVSADPRYPVHLRTIHDPPPVLYCLGELQPDTRRIVAVVGSRRATPYGTAVAGRIAGELARVGFVIVSGMARGIDAAAHRGSLAAGGRTVGVLGCGVDVAYPPDARSLKAAIQAQGAVIAELPLGAAPDSHHFPARNRIISGMALGVLVVEATAESGSLITARLAIEQNRDVFAVPGNVGSSTSLGTNRLIKAGATLVETADDVVEALRGPLGSLGEACPSVPPAPLQTAVELSTDEAELAELLTLDPVDVDTLTTRTGLPPGRVAGILLGLELKGVARHLAGHRYVRNEPRA